MLELRLKHSATALPIYIQLVEQVSWHINHGFLKNGEYLPPSRELARQLGISRGTVVRAYEQLCAKGLCSSQVGKGTTVTFLNPDAASLESQASNAYSPVSQNPTSFLPGGLSLLPSHASTSHLPVSEFRKAFNRILRYPDRLNQFEESAGHPALRKLICEEILPSRGITASPSEVLIVPGSQYGSVLLAMTLMNERSVFHFGDPGYMEFARNFSRFGYELKPHQMDTEGIDITNLSGTPRDILYLMPEHHFPQCITLSDTRRESIIRLAREKKVLLLEDDYDSEFYFDRVPRPALRSSEIAAQVIYMGTFSKVLFNSIRLGYLVAEEQLVKQMASLHWGLSRGTSGLLQQWVSELIKSGTFERQTKRMRTVYRHKRDSVIQLIQKYLPEAQFTVPSGGLQLYICFPDPAVTERIAGWLQKNNIQVVSSQDYLFNQDIPARFLILGFANSAINELEEVLRRLNQFIDKQ